jgi:hypothetical protein
MYPAAALAKPADAGDRWKHADFTARRAKTIRERLKNA